ncbi:hypothetical protein LTR62_000718 [Meristemomyces frigidus]|uniref:Alpha/beta hydrolase fold-3 domain-containing protein n=1 Tax=Meristemomyces frigidus TaxID=1508187 RepID=A0AAN7T9X8_9PEZI|nr:hypothetical protein LTR62_000718 [Meristemomyces frigidus]
MANPQQLGLDREYAARVAGMAELAAGFPQFAVGDIKGRRDFFDNMFAQFEGMTPEIPGLTERSHPIPVSEGTTINLVEFRSSKVPTSGHSPAIFHVHGGGMILGSVETFKDSIAQKSEDYGLPIFSIDYRLAPEHPHPTMINDCYAGLAWLSSHATELGIDNTRILVLGESAGGGIAAGLVLMARDKALQPPIAYQMLVYPMLDDRTSVPQPRIECHTMWKTDDNSTGWTALLGSAAGCAEAKETADHQYAAPARAKDLAGLPPTYIDVGQLDLFAKEDLQYAARLLEAGVMVEYHLYPGLPHGFERMGAGTRIVSSAIANRLRVVEEFKRGQEVKSPV